MYEWRETPRLTMCVKELVVELSYNDKLAIETAEHQDPTESNLSEDNFVGLSEMKSESKGPNYKFVENQTLAEIDPLEVQTEN